MATTNLADGWQLDTYSGHFAPVVSNESEGVHLEIDREGDMEITLDTDTDNMGYASSTAINNVPVTVVKALIAAWEEFMENGAKSSV